MMLLSFFLGATVGSTLGIFLMALLQVSDR